jgi:PKD repeat protein
MKKNLCFLCCILICVSCKKEPVADFEVSGLTKVGETINFVNHSSNSIKYYWDFGDGSTSNQEAPTHIYSKPGDYTVGLDAIGEKGSASVTKPLKITGTTFSFINNKSTTLPNFCTFYWNGIAIEDFLQHGSLLKGKETIVVITTRSEIMFGYQSGDLVCIGEESYTLTPDQHNTLTIDDNTSIYCGKGINDIIIQLGERFSNKKK